MTINRYVIISRIENKNVHWNCKTTTGVAFVALLIPLLMVCYRIPFPVTFNTNGTDVFYSLPPYPGNVSSLTFEKDFGGIWGRNNW